ncbi:MAG: cold shock domain-containing protein [Phormidesmis sp.]
MLKRLMIWLLNQFQKVLGVLKGRGNSARSQKPPEEISSAASSSETVQGSLTRADININTVAPVAQRVSLAAAIPVRAPQESAQSLKSDTVPSLEATAAATEEHPADPLAAPPADSDTHRRLDASAAALSGEEFVVPTLPTTVSKLISPDTSLQFAGGDIALSSPTVDTQGSYQLPAIHDLLPAIELEESDALDELVPLVPEIEPSISEDQSSLEETALESIDSLETETIEQVTLFSFDIYESEIEESDGTEEIYGTEETNSLEETSETEVNKTEEVSETEGIDQIEEVSEVDLSVSLEAIAKTDDDLMSVSNVEAPSLDFLSDPADEALVNDELVEKRLIEEQTDEEPASIPDEELALEPDGESSAISEPDNLQPVNPWLTAIPKNSQESVQAATPTVKIETKPGIIKLLFTIKPGNYHGYIAPDDGSKDILFHQKYINADIFDKIERGTSVTATVKLIEGKAYATHIDLLETL